MRSLCSSRAPRDRDYARSRRAHRHRTLRVPSLTASIRRTTQRPPTRLSRGLALATLARAHRGRLNFSRWRSLAAGDLLERSLRDTDELQDLWLRCVIPLVDVGRRDGAQRRRHRPLAPHGRWWSYAGDLLAVQLLGVAALCGHVGSDLRRDRVLRRARGRLPRPTRRAQRRDTGPRAARSPSTFAERSPPRSHDSRSAPSRLTIGATSPTPGLVLAMISSRARGPRGPPATRAAVAGRRGAVASSTYESLTSFATRSIRRSRERRRRTSRGARPSRSPPRLDAVDASDSRAPRARPNRRRGRGLSCATPRWSSHPGRQVALIGASGVGKSTLLRAIAALDEVADGAITLGRRRSAAISRRRTAPARRLRRERAGTDARLRASTCVTLGRPSPRDALSDLAALGIVADRTTRWEELSRGERARVAMVRAMVTSPRSILLDEPTAGLGRDETATSCHSSPRPAPR